MNPAKLGLWDVRPGQRKIGETVWRWVQSVANPSLLNSLFNRENTGNFFNFEDLFSQNIPDLPAVKGIQEFLPEIRTGNNRELSGK